jgi:hypothetical protein
MFTSRGLRGFRGVRCRRRSRIKIILCLPCLFFWCLLFWLRLWWELYSCEFRLDFRDGSLRDN